MDLWQIDLLGTGAALAVGEAVLTAIGVDVVSVGPGGGVVVDLGLRVDPPGAVALLRDAGITVTRMRRACPVDVEPVGDRRRIS